MFSKNEKRPQVGLFGDILGKAVLTSSSTVRA